MLPAFLNIGPFRFTPAGEHGAMLALRAGGRRPDHSRRHMLAALVALGMAGGGAAWSGLAAAQTANPGAPALAHRPHRAVHRAIRRRLWHAHAQRRAPRGGRNQRRRGLPGANRWSWSSGRYRQTGRGPQTLQKSWWPTRWPPPSGFTQHGCGAASGGVPERPHSAAHSLRHRHTADQQVPGPRATFFAHRRAMPSRPFHRARHRQARGWTQVAVFADTPLRRAGLKDVETAHWPPASSSRCTWPGLPPA